MKKIKSLTIWHFVILLILAMLTFGYFFELGEELGLALAGTN